jgi:hypothetical protein
MVLLEVSLPENFALAIDCCLENVSLIDGSDEILS